MVKTTLLRTCALGVGLALAGPTQAHDPIFGLGPHVLFKKGVEASVALEGSADAAHTALEAAYGLARDLAISAHLTADGDEPARLAGKYRFWRADRLGIQESAAAMLQADGEGGWGTGLAYGFESIRWYRWAALRHQRPQAGTPLWKIDLVGGIRPTPPRYLAPDTVWLLELNTEVLEDRGERAFLSPGIFWTLRNFAIKSGLQLPLAQRGIDAESRFALDLEWHF